MMAHTTLVLLGIAAAGAAQTPAVPQGLDQKVDALVQRYAAFGFEGAVVVAVDDQVAARGYGVADPATGRRNDARTLFEIASITKQFTAAAILVLQQRGALFTTDSIAKHLPSVPEHSRGITIHHLLSHTSGVPGTNTKGSGEDLELAVVEYLGEGPVREPGEKWEYWNGGYALLAGIVERDSGQPFTDFCRENLFVPAGMDDTGFTGSEQLPRDRAAVGTSSRGAPRSALDHPYGSYGYQYRGMGGVVTTVLDLVKWHGALQGDTVLDEAARTALFGGVAHARGQDYAYGWFVGKTVNGTPRHQHGGSVRGFMSDFRRFPEDNACVAVVANGDDWVIPYIAENLESLALGQAPCHPLPPRIEPLTAERLASFAGTYGDDEGNRITVTVDCDALRLVVEGTAILAALKERGAGPETMLGRPVGDNAFAHWTWRGERRFVFERDGERVTGVRTEPGTGRALVPR